MPEYLRTAELCRAAVEKLVRVMDESALKYVPEYLRTAELCRAAVEKNRYALKYVPKPLRTADLIKAAKVASKS